MIPAIKYIPFADGDTMKNQAVGAASAGKAFEKIPFGKHSRRRFSGFDPLTDALAGAGAGNVDNGDHDYKVTMVTALGESTGGTASGGVTVADKTMDGKVALTNIPLGDSRYVLARKIYRRFNGAGSYKLLTTLEDNTTTSYTDNTANAGLGAVMPTTSTADKAPGLRRPKKVTFTTDVDCRVVLGVGSTPTAVAGEGGDLIRAGNYYTMEIPDDVTHFATIAEDGASTGQLDYGYNQMNPDVL